MQVSQVRIEGLSMAQPIFKWVLASCRLAIALGLCTGLLWPGVAFGQDAKRQQQINQAVDKGVAYLKRIQSPNGLWVRKDYERGATALAAWTLLECGVAPNDPVIQKAATAIRRGAAGERQIYTMALDIMFFDKLGDQEDIPLIEALAVRLLASQAQDGGWSYTSISVSAPEQQWLMGFVARRKPPGGNIPARPELPRTFQQITPEMRQRLKLLAANQLPADAPPGYHGSDNSNTQFAMLALWVARRYGIPAEGALMRTGQRFLKSQWKDGSWAYVNADVAKTQPMWRGSQAMTCAGLLGCAVGHASTPAGQAKESREALMKHPSVQAGLALLAKVLKGEESFGEPRKAYYFYWSLERMAVVYDLKDIGGVPWYTWGAERLLKAQSAEGGWVNGEFVNGGCDTCFALLFLKRANVAPDLTAILNVGLIQDAKGGGKDKR
jgi:hypothetical protein